MRSEQDPLSHFKRLQMGIFGFSLKETGTLWQQHSRCHPVSFVMYSSGAKFEDHCSNIFGGIFDSVFYCLSEAIYDVITFLICIIQEREYLSTEIFQKGKRRSFLFRKAFEISSNYFFTS